jgi:hypothetical protein
MFNNNFCFGIQRSVVELYFGFRQYYAICSQIQVNTAKICNENKYKYIVTCTANVDYSENEYSECKYVN